MDSMPEVADMDFEWENRKLCRDERCIGVIGSDGRCKECGMPDEGDDRAGADGPDSIPQKEPKIEIEASEDIPEAEDDWAKRELCGDESCIGVIGPDGRCKECGKEG